MKKIALVLMALFCVVFALSADVFDEERNVLTAPDAVQEKVKSSQDEKNVVSDVDDRDEDSFVKSSENPLNEDAFEFDFDPNPNPDERDL